MSIQDRIDALVARASTDEPTEEARTAAWIAIKTMRQYGGAIRLAHAAHAAPSRAHDAGAWGGSTSWDPFTRDTERARPRPQEDPWRVARSPEPFRCWSCGERFPAGADRATRAGQADKCAECHADGR